MTETKVQLTDRLRRECRWDEASAYRDEARREMRAGGMSRLKANEESWRRMAEKFPALAPDASNKETDKLTEPAGPPFPTDLPPSTGNFLDDLRWAFLTIGDDVGPYDAPNGSAWYLRVWGLSEEGRDKFIAMAAKLLKRNRDADRFAEDRRRQFDLLASLRRELEAKESDLKRSDCREPATQGRSSSENITHG